MREAPGSVVAFQRHKRLCEPRTLDSLTVEDLCGELLDGRSDGSSSREDGPIVFDEISGRIGSEDAAGGPNSKFRKLIQPSLKLRIRDDGGASKRMQGQEVLVPCDNEVSISGDGNLEQVVVLRGTTDSDRL